MMRVFAAVVGILLVLAGCDDMLVAEADGSPLELIHVQTEEVRYTRAAVDVPVPVTFVVENQTSRAVVIHRCGERVMAAVDRKEGTVWTQHSGDICLMNLPMVPIELGSGGSVQGVRQVQAPGTYRLRIGVDRGNAQVMWTVTSNEFVVE